MLLPLCAVLLLLPLSPSHAAPVGTPGHAVNSFGKINGPLGISRNAPSQPAQYPWQNRPTHKTFNGPGKAMYGHVPDQVATVKSGKKGPPGSKPVAIPTVPRLQKTSPAGLTQNRLPTVVISEPAESDGDRAQSGTNIPPPPRNKAQEQFLTVPTRKQAQQSRHQEDKSAWSPRRDPSQKPSSSSRPKEPPPSKPGSNGGQTNAAPSARGQWQGQKSTGPQSKTSISTESSQNSKKSPDKPPSRTVFGKLKDRVMRIFGSNSKSSKSSDNNSYMGGFDPADDLDPEQQQIRR